jgi:hypothetical protein
MRFQRLIAHLENDVVLVDGLKAQAIYVAHLEARRNAVGKRFGLEYRLVLFERLGRGT